MLLHIPLTVATLHLRKTGAPPFFLADVGAAWLLDVPSTLVLVRCKDAHVHPVGVGLITPATEAASVGVEGYGETEQGGDTGLCCMEHPPSMGSVLDSNLIRLSYIRNCG